MFLSRLVILSKAKDLCRDASVCEILRPGLRPFAQNDTYGRVARNQLQRLTYAVKDDLCHHTRHCEEQRDEAISK
jgi:hypothetical protein